MASLFEPARLSLTILFLILAIVFLCLWRIFNQPTLLTISIIFFVLWLAVWLIESILDRDIKI